MKNSIFTPVLVLGSVFLLASCTTTSNHTMDSGSTMSGATHMATGTSTNTHMMGGGDTMSGSVHTDGDTHTMKNGSTMDGMNMDDGTESQ